MKGSWRRRYDAWAKHTTARKAGKADKDWRIAFRHCRNWAVPGKLRCHLHSRLSTGPKTTEGGGRIPRGSPPRQLEGRRRRIAQRALAGKKINTGPAGGQPAKGRPAKGRQRALTTNQQIEALCTTMAVEQKEHDRLRRLMRKVKRGGAQGHDAAKAYACVKSDEEVIEWAKAALPGLRQWLLGGPKSF
jgi:hypothetical protein